MTTSRDDRFKHRRQAGGLLGAAFDEVFHPDAKQARQVWEASQELPAQAPSPGGASDLDSGRIVIVLPPAADADV